MPGAGPRESMVGGLGLARKGTPVAERANLWKVSKVENVSRWPWSCITSLAAHRFEQIKMKIETVDYPGCTTS